MLVGVLRTNKIYKLCEILLGNNVGPGGRGILRLYNIRRGRTAVLQSTLTTATKTSTKPRLARVSRRHLDEFRVRSHGQIV